MNKHQRAAQLLYSYLDEDQRRIYTAGVKSSDSYYWVHDTMLPIVGSAGGRYVMYGHQFGRLTMCSVGSVRVVRLCFLPYEPYPIADAQATIKLMLELNEPYALNTAVKFDNETELYSAIGKKRTEMILSYFSDRPLPTDVRIGRTR